MSIQDKITRLQTAKTNIANAITAKGGIVDGRDGFEEFADDIATIETGANLDDFIAGTLKSVTYNGEIVPDYAFAGKNELEEVNLPNATYIGKNAFSCNSSASGSGSGGDEPVGFNNKNLKTVNMPKVTNIGDSAFSGDENLEITELPDSLTVIGNSAFKNCPKVQLTSLPANLMVIEDDGLAIETIPNIVELIENSELVEFPINETVEALIKNRIREFTIYDSQADKDFTDLENVPKKWIEINSLRQRFLNTSYMKTIDIPDSVTRIGSEAFYNCNALTSLTIGNSVTDIGNNAFSGCNALASLTIGNSVTDIGNNAFGGCNALTSLTIPDSVTNIDGNAFCGCNALTSLTIPDSVTDIGSYAFDGCNALASLTIGNSVTDIGNGAFCGCNHLTDIYYSGTEEEWNAITGISGCGFKGTETIHYTSTGPEE